MKRSFIRGLWGDGLSKFRRGKLITDIQRVKDSSYEPEFDIYVFGTENFKLLKELGFNCKLIYEKSSKWDMVKQLYRHKLDVIDFAANDYDEIVFLDWDCIATKPVPETFWNDMNKGRPLQANLFQYRTKKCLWRSEDFRKVCNGGFIYVRDKSLTKQFIDNYNYLWAWVENQKVEREKRGLNLRFREEALIFDDEPAISKAVDQMMGGWKGLDAYWDDGYEPMCCNLNRKSAFPQDKLNSKDTCFTHMVK